MSATRSLWTRLARSLVGAVVVTTVAVAAATPAQAAGETATPSTIDGVPYGDQVTVTLPGCNGALFGAPNDSGVYIDLHQSHFIPHLAYSYTKRAVDGEPWVPTIVVTVTKPEQLQASCRHHPGAGVDDDSVDYGAVNIKGYPNILTGELGPGRALVAPVGDRVPPLTYRFSMDIGPLYTTDGDLALTAPDGTRLWSRYAGRGSRLVMQQDGNLVLYAPAGQGALWSTGTEGNPGARLVLQTDGNLVIYSATGKPLWFTGADRAARIPARPGSNGFGRGAGITPGVDEAVASANGYRLVTQPDGNIVLYNRSSKPIWWTGANKDRTFLTLQKDGNLVRYDRFGKPLWWTGTSTGTSFVVQEDGNLVLYDAANKPLWHSGTAGR